MEKRVFFRSGGLPWLLLAPQMLVILVFFFWPAGQALYQSLQQQDPFGTSIEYVGLDNFRALGEADPPAAVPPAGRPQQRVQRGGADPRPRPGPLTPAR